MSVKQAWNKVKETAQNGIFGIFEPHRLYQIAHGWSFQNIKRKFNQTAQNDNQTFLSMMFAASAYNTAPLQPAMVQVDTHRDQAYTPNFY